MAAQFLYTLFKKSFFFLKQIFRHFVSRFAPRNFRFNESEARLEKTERY